MCLLADDCTSGNDAPVLFSFLILYQCLHNSMMVVLYLFLNALCINTDSFVVVLKTFQLYLKCCYYRQAEIAPALSWDSLPGLWVRAMPKRFICVKFCFSDHNSFTFSEKKKLHNCYRLFKWYDLPFLCFV